MRVSGRKMAWVRGAVAGFLLAAAFALPAKAQTVSCTGPTGANCVPVVQIPSSLANPAIGSGNSGYPLGSTPVQNSATGTTAGTTATLPAAANQFTYLCGFSVSPGSATTAITISITTTGLASNQTLSVGAPATAVGTTGLNQYETFTPCLKSSLVNTPITVVAGALGTAGVNQAVNAWGYTQ